jgi:HD-like signal output (HDOD) protein
MQVDPFEGFLAGLLQNVGLLTSLRVLDQMADGTQPIGSESFCTALINYGRILSCSIGREWHFPPAVTEAIREQGNAVKDAQISSIGTLLSVGDYLSKMHMLIRHDSLPAHVASYVNDLSTQQTACLEALNRLQEGEI